MKLLTFFGLSHHGARLMPLLEELEARGHEIEVITTQNETGGPALEFEMSARGSGFLVHHLLDLRTASLAELLDSRRRELARVLRAALIDGGRLPALTSEATLAAALSESVSDDVVAEHLLMETRADALLVLHENNFWTRTLAGAAVRLSVPVFSLQEGIFLDVYPEAMLSEYGRMAQRVFLWGEEDRERLIEAGVAEARLSVVGPSHLDEIVELRVDRTRARARLGIPGDDVLVTLVVPSLKVAPLSEVFVAALSEALRDLRVRLAVKWKPGEDSAESHAVDAALASRLGDRYLPVRDGDPYHLVLAANLVLGGATTLAAEAVALGCPFLEVAWGRCGDDPILGLSRRAGVESIRGDGDMSKIQSYLVDGPPAGVIQRVQAYRDRCFHGLEGGVTRGIADRMDVELRCPTRVPRP